MACKRKVDAEVIREDIFNQTIPKCGRCPEPESESSGPEMPFLIGPSPPIHMPVMKPDIVFFGEGLPDHFHECISRCVSLWTMVTKAFVPKYPHGRFPNPAHAQEGFFVTDIDLKNIFFILTKC